MKQLPSTNETLLVRTDFSDESAWQEVCAAVRAMDPEMRQALERIAAAYESMGQSFPVDDPSVHFVDDKAYEGATIEQFLELVRAAEPRHFLMFVADETAISQPEHPIVVVDLIGKPGQTFRTLPSHVSTIASNLSIANCDWEDFTKLLDKNGLYRGFGQ